MRKIRQNLGLCLIISACIFSAGCATTARPVTPAKFDANWTFERGGAGEAPKACLYEEDVAKLKELLDRCQAAQ